MHSRNYRNYCFAIDFNLSYSKKNCSYDNASTESFNAIVKKELINHTIHNTFEGTKISIFNFIEKWYNRERIYGSNDNMYQLNLNKMDYTLFKNAIL